jgi:hypothetical protein
MTTTLTIFEGYAIGTIALKATGKGAAEAVVTYDDGSTKLIASFVRDATTNDERWLTPGYPRSLKRSWRLDVAINKFYENKDLLNKAISSSNYSPALKYDLLERLVQL